jgi:Diacylglycerol acyltransferase
MSSFFTMTFLMTPLYLVTAMVSVWFLQFYYSIIIWAPLLLSAILPSTPSPTLCRLLSPLLSYFEYEQIIETAPVDVREEMKRGTQYIIGIQPHGVVSFVGICAAINAPPEFLCHLRTAVASAVLKTPIVKHVMGIFGLIDASKRSLQKHLRSKKGIAGSVYIYVGGIAELFLSSPKDERLFLSERKGFIKLALQEGVDVVPVYLFGNTSVLTILKTGILATLSRRLQVSLTYFWGKFGLPLPRDEKLLYVCGQPLGMPKIEQPTQEDIDTWHVAYCVEVTRIFDTYKERVPAYKHKTLIIE